MNQFQNLNLGADLLNAKVNAGVKALPPFYRNILDMWFSFKGTRSSSPQTRDVMAEPIFFNRQILDTDTGLPLKAPPIYVEHGLVRVTDISYSVVPGLLPDAAVHEILGTQLAPALYKQARDNSPVCTLCDCDVNETLTHLFF